MADRTLPNILRRWSTVVVVAIIAAAVAVKWNGSLLPEHATVPAPAMPSPNARDLYNLAEAKMVDLGAVDWDASGERLSDSNMYLTAASSWLPRNRPLTLAERERLVAENRAAIETLRAGMKDRYLSPPARSYCALLPYLAMDRQMARLLAFAGQTQSLRGNWAEAARCRIDAIKLGVDIPHGSVLLGTLAGLACQSVGRRHCADAIPHLSAGDAERDARRLLAIDDSAQSPGRSIQEEEWYGEASLLDLFRRRDWQKTFTATTGDGTPWSATALSRKLLLHIQSPRLVYRQYSRYMDASAAVASEPWPIQKGLAYPPLPTAAAARAAVPPIRILAFRCLASSALDRLLAVQFALKAYRGEHGGYPARLSDLTPSILMRVPEDPFTARQPLKYARTAAGYLLYSVGPDAVDDHGKPILASYGGKMTRNVLASDAETGDIVANVNF